MRRTERLQEIRPACALHADRKMRFEELYGIWTEKQLSQEEAARIRGITGQAVDAVIITSSSRG